jgi:hypothetical protein
MCGNEKWNLNVAYRYVVSRYMEVDRWNLSNWLKECRTNFLQVCCTTHIPPSKKTPDSCAVFNSPGIWFSASVHLYTQATIPIICKSRSYSMNMRITLIRSGNCALQGSVRCLELKFLYVHAVAEGRDRVGLKFQQPMHIRLVQIFCHILSRTAEGAWYLKVCLTWN